MVVIYFSRYFNNFYNFAKQAYHSDKFMVRLIFYVRLYLKVELTNGYLTYIFVKCIKTIHIIFDNEIKRKWGKWVFFETKQIQRDCPKHPPRNKKENPGTGHSDRLLKTNILAWSIEDTRAMKMFTCVIVKLKMMIYWCIVYLLDSCRLLRMPNNNAMIY